MSLRNTKNFEISKILGNYAKEIEQITLPKKEWLKEDEKLQKSIFQYEKN